MCSSNPELALYRQPETRIFKCQDYLSYPSPLLVRLALIASYHIDQFHRSSCHSSSVEKPSSSSPQQLRVRFGFITSFILTRFIQVQYITYHFIACFKAPYPFSPSQCWYVLIFITSTILKAIGSPVHCILTQMAAFNDDHYLWRYVAMLSVIACSPQVRQQPLRLSFSLTTHSAT